MASASSQLMLALNHLAGGRYFYMRSSSKEMSSQEEGGEKAPACIEAQELLRGRGSQISETAHPGAPMSLGREATSHLCQAETVATCHLATTPCLRLSMQQREPGAPHHLHPDLSMLKMFK
jgi:hypothetical protein